ncbi:hypothetical protein ISR94_03625 [Candidatus Microgenomates bacterium]|nr:hypothetical protein [Candidatus Microgenomates bacterium]
MKKLLLIICFVFLLVPSVVVAENVTTTTPNTSAKVQAKNRINTDEPVRGDIRQKTETKREEVQVKLSASRRERIRSFSGKMVTRIEALIERLGNLIARMEARIVKINEGESDINTTQAASDIAEAKVLLASASTSLTDMSAAMDSVLESDDPKNAFIEVRTILKDIKADLKEIHRLLVHSIGELKGLRVGDTNEE